MLPSNPAGVNAIAIAFFFAAAYLGLIGIVMLASPGVVSMALGAPLLSGLELAGPYMFLLMSAVGALVGGGGGPRCGIHWSGDAGPRRFGCGGGFSPVAALGRTGNYRPSDDRLVSVSIADRRSFHKRLATDPHG